MNARRHSPGDVVVIGIGNPFRRDDGVGPAVADRLRAQRLPGVRLAVSTGETSALIELWAGAKLAVVVDALRTEPPTPGRIHRLSVLERAEAGARQPVPHPLPGGPSAAGAPPDLGAPPAAGALPAAGAHGAAGARPAQGGPSGGAAAEGGCSGGGDYGEAVELARILGLLPDRLVLFAVEASDMGFGPGLTPAVAAAAGRVAAEIANHVAAAA